MHARRYLVLMDKLALGEGCGDSHARVRFPSQHIKSYQMWTSEGKTMRTLNPSDMNESMMLRYVQVQECFFDRVRHPSIASDGFRVAAKDVNYLCSGGEHKGRYGVGWGVMVLR